jgi:hypothetical protein
MLSDSWGAVSTNAVNLMPAIAGIYLKFTLEMRKLLDRENTLDRLR